MTHDHPITPPPELVQQWRRSGPADAAANNAYERHIATMAARWGADHQLKLDTEQINQAWQKGADQELEACCEWLVKEGWFRYEHEAVQELRTARRPEPPSLKKQALIELGDVYNRDKIDDVTYDIIRKALEQLNV